MEMNPSEEKIENKISTNNLECTWKRIDHQEITKTDSVKEVTENFKKKQDKGSVTVMDKTTNIQAQVMKDIKSGVSTGNENCLHLSANKICTPTQGGPVHVCQSCQHLYDKNQGVVLTASTLSHTHNHIHDQHERSFLSPAKSWKARRYDGLCSCSETGEACHCKTPGSQTSMWQRLLPRNAPWWPCLKITLLVISAILPWVFLITYLVFAYKT